MRNLGFFLSLCLLSAVPALAAETNRPAAAAPDEASQIAAAEEQPVEIAVPEFNVSPELEVGATPRPECSDPRLTQKIVEKIEAYQSEHPATMLIDRRRDILLRRNLCVFLILHPAGHHHKRHACRHNRHTEAKENRRFHHRHFIFPAFLILSALFMRCRFL